MKCNSCKHWIITKKTTYGDGSEVANFQASEGKGLCEQLKIETPPEFGCVSFEQGYEHVQLVEHKPYEPWRYWKMGPCPDCQGKGNNGDSGCRRCCGTANVRFYDDGHVGDERTRRHPKEPVFAKPKCHSCSREVEPEWVACPKCGHKLEAMAETERPKDGGMNFTPEAAGWRLVFGVTRDWRGSSDDLTFLYHARAKVCHPDTGGSDVLMQQLNAAYAEARSELGIQ